MEFVSSHHVSVGFFQMLDVNAGVSADVSQYVMGWQTVSSHLNCLKLCDLEQGERFMKRWMEVSNVR